MRRQPKGMFTFEALNRVAQKYLPHGVGVRYRTRGLLPAEAKHNEIYVPKVVSLHTLQIFLHECAHWHLGHCHRTDNFELTSATKEYQAETTSFKWLRDEGYIVPKGLQRLAQENVRDHLTREEKYGDPNGRSRKIVRRFAHYKQ